jgi:hypothetical protein
MVVSTVEVLMSVIVVEMIFVEKAVAMVEVLVRVTVRVTVTGEMTREQAEVMMLAGYLLRHEGRGTARLLMAFTNGAVLVDVVVVVVGDVSVTVPTIFVVGTAVVFGLLTVAVVESVKVVITVIGRVRVVVVLSREVIVEVLGSVIVVFSRFVATRVLAVMPRGVEVATTVVVVTRVA